MSLPLAQRIPFTKIVVVFACLFGLSFGLCGLSAFSAGLLHGSTTKVPIVIGIAGGALFVLSSVGLVITLIVWVIVSIFSRASSQTTNRQTPYGDSHHDPKPPEDQQ